VNRPIADCLHFTAGFCSRRDFADTSGLTPTARLD
jgi:hypothetical protein